MCAMRFFKRASTSQHFQRKKRSIKVKLKYQEIETHIRDVKAYREKNSQKLTQTLETR